MRRRSPGHPARTLEFIHDENLARCTYTGPWARQENSSGNLYLDGGGVYVNPGQAAHVEVSFVGNQFKLWGVVGTSGYQGKVHLYIDGAEVLPQPTQHLSSPFGQENESFAWYTSPVLSAGPHTIRLAQDPTEANGYLVFDGLEVLQTESTTPSLEPEASQFLAVTGIEYSQQGMAINKLVHDLKITGLWNKMTAVYPMIGGTAFTHQFNLKDPRDANEAFHIQWVGAGATHSALGAQGTSDGVGITGIVPALHLEPASVHLAFYAGNEFGSFGQYHAVFMGAAEDNFSHGLYLYARQFENYWSFRANSTEESGATQIDRSEVGMNLMSRTAANVAKLFSRGELITNFTNINFVTGRTSASLALFGINHPTGVTNNTQHQCRFASVGAGLTDAETVMLTELVNDYQARLGRAI